MLINRKKHQGVALVLVLWMLVLLIILATGYSRLTRSDSLLTATMVASAKARTSAEAGIAIMAANLLDSQNSEKISSDGTIHRVKFDKYTLKISVQAETGKIDINTADSELLYGLIRKTGLSEEETLPLLHAILDWRDRDNLKRVHGAEENEYKDMDIDYKIKNGFFNTVNELLMVKGFSKPILDKIAPYLTVHSHYSGVHIQSASKTVLLSIPGISETEVEEFIELRNNTSAGDIDSVLPTLKIKPKYKNADKGKIYTVTSHSSFNDTNAVIVAVIALGKSANEPYTVLSWKESYYGELTKVANQAQDI